MPAIQTKYICPTNTQGSKVRAVCRVKSLTIKWDSSLNIEANHIRAAKKLCELLEWDCSMCSGQLKDGSFAHVLYNFKYGESENGQKEKQGQPA